MLGRVAPLTVGLLLDCIDNEYASALAFAFADEVRARGFRGMCFSEGRAEASAECLATRLALAAPLDAAILAYAAPRTVQDAGAKLGKLPLCTYSAPLPSVPWVTVDHAAGMKQAVEHLIQVHGYRRIAFLRGPADNQDAELRYAGYRSALQQANISIDEQLIAFGDLASGEVRGLHVLLDERRLGFDAVVAANDTLALSALSELRKRGFRVPRDVALVGFGDLEGTRFASPPVSSVRQPFRAQVQLAFDLLVAQLAGRTVTESPAVAADFVPRGSCGCGLSGEPGQQYTSVVPRPLSEGSDWMSGWAFSLRQYLEMRDVQLEQSRAGQLVHAFWGQVTRGGNQFIEQLERELRDGLRQTASLSAWYGAIGRLRRDVLGRVETRPVLRSATETLTHAAFQHVSDAAERQQAVRRLAFERYGRRLSQVGADAITAFDLAGIRASLYRHLSALDIDDCFVLRFEPGAEATRTVAAQVQGEPMRQLGELCAQQELLPRAMWSTASGGVYVVQGLEFRGEPLGAVVTSLGPREGVVYRALQEQLVAAITGASLVAQVEAEVEHRRLAEQQRLESELSVAQSVQSCLLPRQVVVEGYEVAHSLLRQGGEGAGYYDVQPMQGGAWILVANVARTQLAPHLVMPVAHGIFATLCRASRESSPEALALRWERLFWERLGGSGGGRLIYSLARLSGGRVSWAGVPPVVLRASNAHPSSLVSEQDYPLGPEDVLMVGAGLQARSTDSVAGELRILRQGSVEEFLSSYVLRLGAEVAGRVGDAACVVVRARAAQGAPRR